MRTSDRTLAISPKRIPCTLSQGAGHIITPENRDASGEFKRKYTSSVFARGGNPASVFEKRAAFLAHQFGPIGQPELLFG